MAVTREQFVANLVRSGLMSADEVASFQRERLGQGRDVDVEELARELVRAGKLTKYQATTIYQGKTKGLVLGDYVVLDRIGAGGMGQVFKARHRWMNRIVAVKLLSAAAIRSPEAVRRFYREVQTAARLAHPHIVTAFDAGEHEGLHYLVMEYVEGRDLARIVAEEGPLSVERAVGYVVQAARGLEYAHGEGVVHRDVKPGNLLFDDRGTVKILDMGLARIQTLGKAGDAPNSERLTETGQVMGTCDYMAPEQAEDTRAADHRADVYALGCTLYRLLTGDPPYAGETLMQVLLAHREAPIPSLCDARPEVPPEVDAVFRRMVAKRPHDRYPSMTELTADLEACLAGGRPLSHSPSQPPAPPVAGPARSADDSQLDAFLAALSPGRAAAVAKAPPIAEETIAHRPGQETGVVAPEPSSPMRRPGRRRLLLGVGGGIAALVLGAAAILAVALHDGGGPRARGPADPAARESADAAPRAELASRRDDACLILRWPASQRDDAVLEIDGRAHEVSELVDGDHPDRLRVPLRPGTHKLWIARRGIAPFERRFTLRAGETTRIAPVWKEPADTQQPEPSEVAAADSPSEDAMTEPSAAESAKPPAEPPADDRGPTEPCSHENGGQAAEARYAAAIEPAEALIADVRFCRALGLLEELRFEEEDLAARLDRRRDEVAKLAAVKARIIDAINGADPPLEKSDLRIRGANGKIVEADDEAITAELITGKRETLAWADVGPQSVRRLVELVGDEPNADDCVAAGLLALVYGDAAYAATMFTRADELGAQIEPYLGPLASSALAHVEQLIEQKKFDEAEAALADLETKYADTPWFASHSSAVEAARTAIGTGIPEQEAEKLYAQAARLFADEQLFELKPVVEKLRADYRATCVATDADREPSVAEMEAAVADLGVRLSVRLDGQGDFTSIQGAIDAAPPNSLIEVADNGPYHESLVVDKPGTTIRGVPKAWPVVTSEGLPTKPCDLVQVAAPNVRLQRFLLLHTNQGTGPQIVHVNDRAGVELRNVVASQARGTSMEGILVERGAKSVEIRGSVIIGQGWLTSATIRDSFWFCRTWDHVNGMPGCVLENSVVSGNVGEFDGGVLRRSVVWGDLRVENTSSSLFDSIVKTLTLRSAASRIKNCDVLELAGSHRPSEGYFSADPMFVNRKAADYRLLPASPCIGRASDGGDVGCRYTPEMIEMITLALQLRRAGIIKF